jgi:hypothetical protein
VQQEFVDKYLKPRLEEAKAGNRAVFFCGCFTFCFVGFFGFSLVGNTDIYQIALWQAAF